MLPLPAQDRHPSVCLVPLPPAVGVCLVGSWLFFRLQLFQPRSQLIRRCQCPLRIRKIEVVPGRIPIQVESVKLQPIRFCYRSPEAGYWYTGRDG